jgi:hypothetical protein
VIERRVSTTLQLHPAFFSHAQAYSMIRGSLYAEYETFKEFSGQKSISIFCTEKEGHLTVLELLISRRRNGCHWMNSFLVIQIRMHMLSIL